MTSPVIPEGQRWPGLREYLGWALSGIREAVRNRPNLAFYPSPFTFLCYPWLAPSGWAPPEILDQWRKERQSLPFDGERAKAGLEACLAADQHLRQCCPTPLDLAALLDRGFLSAALAESPDEAAIEKRLARLDFEIYSRGPFRLIAATHLYNFAAEGDPPEIELGEHFAIKRFDGGAIPRLTGEPADVPSFLHPAGIGDYFVVQAFAGRQDEPAQALSEARERALDLARVLQYFKDGVVHAAYTAPYFLPPVVDGVRRAGVFYLGSPRRDPCPAAPFRLSSGEIAEFKLWWAGYQREVVQEVLYSEKVLKNRLRQAILRAGEFFEASHQDGDGPRRLIDLAIGFEALFSPSDQGELRFRIAASAATLLGTGPADRRKIFAAVSDLYTRRSKLLHGTYDTDKYAEGTFVSSEEIAQWSSLLRRALLSALVYYLRGKRDHHEFRNALTDALLDEGTAHRLRTEADIGSIGALIQGEIAIPNA